MLVYVIWTNIGNQQKHSWHMNTELSSYVYIQYNEVSSASLTVSMALNTMGISRACLQITLKRYCVYKVKLKTYV